MDLNSRLFDRIRIKPRRAAEDAGADNDNSLRVSRLRQ